MKINRIIIYKARKTELKKLESPRFIMIDCIGEIKRKKKRDNENAEDEL